MKGVLYGGGRGYMFFFGGGVIREVYYTAVICEHYIIEFMGLSVCKLLFG